MAPRAGRPDLQGAVAPENSVRSAVQASGGPPTSRKATHPAWVSFQALRAIAPVSESRSVTMNGAPIDRCGPSTHSA
jgi:hypothetical protein